jgi:ankyrin repeat protein
MFLLRNKKTSCLLCLFFILSVAARLSALGRSDKYEDLMQNGSLQNITDALKNDSDLVTYTVGTNNDTLLMSAVSYKRTRRIIKLLLDAGVSPAKKNKLGQSAISYACQYCDDPDTVSLILSYGSFSKSQIRTRLMTRDKTKKYAVQYEDENQSAEVKKLVKSYLPDSDIALLAQTEAGQSAPPEEKALAQETSIQAESTAVTSPAPAAPAVSAPVPIVPAVVPVSPPALSTPEAAAAPPQKSPENEPEKDLLIEETVQASGNQAVTGGEKAVLLPPSNSSSAQVILKASPYKKMSLYDYASDGDENGNTTAAALPAQTFISNANKAGQDGVTQLMTALKTGNDWEFNALLYSGADVNAKDADGWTPLMYAARYQNNEQFVNTLIQRGAQIRTQNIYNASALTLASQYSENPAIISQLLTAYSAGEEEVFKALIYSITGNVSSDRILIAKVQLFIDKGTPINRFWVGKTPLMYAAEYCSSTTVLDLLLKSGAIVSISTSGRKTAFDFAQTNTQLKHDQIYWSLNTGR